MQALRHEFVAEKIVKLPDANEFDPLLRNSPRLLNRMGSCSACLTSSIDWLGLDFVLVAMIGELHSAGPARIRSDPHCLQRHCVVLFISCTCCSSALLVLLICSRAAVARGTDTKAET